MKKTQILIIGFIVIVSILTLFGQAMAVDKEALKLELHATNVALRETVTIHKATYEAFRGMIDSKELEIGTRIKNNSDFYNTLQDFPWK